MWAGAIAVAVFAFPILAPTIHSYTYVSSDGGFEELEVPEKGRPLEMVEKHFEEYKAAKADPEIVLLRTRRREWWQYWEWYDYVTHRRWEYPRLAPS